MVFAINRKGGENRDPEGVKIRYTIQDEIVHFQSNYPTKYFSIQKIQFDDGKEEIRFGYYIMGKLGKMKGKWTWGQFAPFIPIVDLQQIIKKMQEKGWI